MKGLCSRFAFIAMLAGLLGMAAASCQAQASFPDRTIRIIVPFAAGGPVDVAARPLAVAMQEILGATVLIENRPGAGGITGSEAVANATPDGYTLLMTTGSHIGNKVFNPTQVRYDPLTSFAPIMGLIEASGLVLVINKDIPADSITALIAHAKAKPNGMTYAYSGIGNVTHVAGELLKQQTGMQRDLTVQQGWARSLNITIE